MHLIRKNSKHFRWIRLVSIKGIYKDVGVFEDFLGASIWRTRAAAEGGFG